MSKKRLFLVMMIAMLMLAAIAPADAQDKVKIVWFCCLGTGDAPLQQETQLKVVEDFNNSQDAIELEIQIVLNAQSTAALSTLIGSGEPPDIVGPVGFGGSLAFAGQWLDLQPLVDSTGYDLADIPANLVDSYRTLGEGLTGLPFLVFPGLLYYNVDLFDEAGLNYPPAVAGDPYVMPDGTEVPWDYNTVTEIGKILTVDSNGNDATSPDFDPANTIQFGFVHQWDTTRSNFHTFGAGYVVDENGQVTIHEHWRAEAQWWWNAIWSDHIYPTDSYIASELMNANAFSSGRVAMARVMAWYTCCLGDMESNWDLAVQPAYEGTIYAPIDLDTFRIHKDTEHPEEAFTVLSYLLGEAALDLATVYGGFPARPELQESWIQAKAEQYPSVTHWEVVPNSGGLAPNPHHEEWYPGYNQGQIRFGDFKTLLGSDGGGDIDLNAELDRLQSDLQAIVDAAE
jgi:multiple sugar transport system substrate-binding protein